MFGFLVLLFSVVVAIIIIYFFTEVLFRTDPPTDDTVESFSNQKALMMEEDLMEDLKEDVIKSKKPWEAYIGRYHDDPEQPYLLFRVNQDQVKTEEAVLRARVVIENGHREISIYNNATKRIVLIAREVKPNVPTYNGSVNGKPFHMKYRDAIERIRISKGHREIEIIGRGVKGHRKSLPHPWYLAEPLVFRERGNVPVAAIVYAEDKSKVHPSSQSLPMEISIPETGKDDLSLYFFVYIALQEALRARV